MEDHQNLCFNFSCQKVKLPKPKEDGTPPICRFINYEKRMKVRFVIYADFEALNVRKKEKLSKKVTQFAEQKPSGYRIAVIDTYNKKKSLVLTERYTGADMIEKFVARINQISCNLKATLSEKAPMKKLGLEEISSYNNFDTCHICRCKIYKHEKKVRDHCHVSGKYRGAAHFDCNVRYRQPNKIPICFHNFRNYDSQILISNLKKIHHQKVVIIPHNTEKFTSIIISNYYIIDTYLHTLASLDDLVKSLEPDTCSKEEFISRFKPLIELLVMKNQNFYAEKGFIPMNTWIVSIGF